MGFETEIFVFECIMLCCQPSDLVDEHHDVSLRFFPTSLNFRYVQNNISVDKLFMLCPIAKVVI